MSEQSFNYQSAGVDIETGNKLVELIKPIARKTHRTGVMTGLGGFASLFELPLDRYKQPVLVSATDGVGTKLKLALKLGIHQTVGIDLVAMCVNDIVVLGAEPLFFLDYYATAKLDLETASSVIAGIGKGCELAGTALVGGETAEMPGMYMKGDYDLAGFSVGIVEKNKIIDGKQVKAGDKLVAIASSGPHSNGYSLIRKIIESKNISLDDLIDGVPLAQVLLKPTKIYVKSLLKLLKTVPVHALAHITGGGLTENIPRVLPNNLKASINLNNWEFPAIFTWLQQQGKITQENMLTTFNCGIGMVVCIDVKDEAETLDILRAQGETVFTIGEIVAASESTKILYKQ